MSEAALPQHSAESLRLSVDAENYAEATPRAEAQPPGEKSSNGKAEPYRTVLRQSLKNEMIGSDRNSTEPTSKPELYEQLASQLSSLLAGERDLIANAANFSSLIFHALPDLNWAGFYFVKDDELVLGPFQGQPACVRIRIGQGVCGAGAAKCETVIVPNVHEFPGHIACDSASNSEIVVPLLKTGKLLGVLDLDSPVVARFDAEDGRGLENLVRILLSSVSL